jgi:carboxymethylenebutenolidase
MTKGVQDRMIEVARVRDAFHAAVYTAHDLDVALALAAEDCSMQHLPAARSANGLESLRGYLAEEVLPHLPADLQFRRVSRTGDRWRVAQEDMVSFTHDRELPWLLADVEPTGRRVEVVVMSVVTVERSKIKSYRTLWDHAALVTQLGIDAQSCVSGGQ